MNRIQLFGVWVLCVLFSPILLTAMLVQVLFGSKDRALSMAIAQDQCGNALFGGPADQTISTRTGNGLVEGLKWAKVVAPCIDLFFGKGHCLKNASIPVPAELEKQYENSSK